MVDRLINPAFGDRPIEELTPAMVNSRHSSLPPGRPTMLAHTYSLLRTLMNAEVQEQFIVTNPCTIKGAGSRHTGAVLAAQAGAIMPEVMNRLGHSSAQAAPRYQHVARDRDAEIAAAMSRSALVQ